MLDSDKDQLALSSDPRGTIGRNFLGVEWFWDFAKGLLEIV